MFNTEGISNLRKKLSEGDGFFSRFKRMGASLLAILENRLTLLSVEIEAEKLRLFSVLFAGMASLFFLGLGILFSVLTVIVLFWDTYREWVLGGFSVLFLALGIVFFCMAKKQRDLPSSAFRSTIDELQKDRKTLNDDQ